MTISIILIICAIVLWFLAAFRVPAPVHFGWLGLALYGLSVVIR